MLLQLCGPHDARLAMIRSNRGCAQQAGGDPRAAAESQRQAHAILLDHYGPDHRDTRLVAVRTAGRAGC